MRAYDCTRPEESKFKLFKLGFYKLGCVGAEPKLLIQEVFKTTAAAFYT